MTARIIKADQTAKMDIRPAAKGLLFAERLQARKQAAEILDSARHEAAEIVARGQSELERTLESGREQGRARGYAEIARRTAELVRLGKALDRRLKNEAVELACEMCRRILRRELELKPESVAGICAGVIADNRPGNLLTILVHPDDTEIVRRKLSRLADDPVVEIKIESSNRVERGGCVVRGEQGQVDGRLAVQIEELARVIREGLDDD